VGEKLAARIVEFRQEAGPVQVHPGADERQGIGEKNLQKLQPYLTVSDARGPAAR
jgi:DNA uptake protein ComE-like DNA-binding protein